MSMTFIDNKKNKKWEDITRVESFFCSHLYHTIINREKEFIEWLNNNTALKLNSNSDWEVGYEVCFYRDLIKYWKAQDKTIPNENQYSLKRTFDLCMLSNEQIVIIEAKAQQNFHGKQREDALDGKDVMDIMKLLGSQGYEVKVDMVLLHSRKYTPDNDLIKITWEKINSSFQKSKIFERADSIYKD